MARALRSRTPVETAALRSSAERAESRRPVDLMILLSHAEYDGFDARSG